MAEVLFYHLTRSPLEITLPDLLEKSRARGWKALVKACSAERLKWLDEKLWTGSDISFLAHGLAGGRHDARQPVLLTLTSNNPNGAEILFTMDGAELDPQEAEVFTRTCILFDGNDDSALAQARGQWKLITDAGLPARYWSQENGAWVQKASKNC